MPCTNTEVSEILRHADIMCIIIYLTVFSVYVVVMVYLACEYCLRALETAEENARRLSGLPALSLPHPEVCKVRPDRHQACPQCQVHSHQYDAAHYPVVSCEATQYH